MKTTFMALLALAVATFAHAMDGAQEPVMKRAHSHNDYEQKRPLDEALDNKFGSVEADIFLVDGELLVAHTAKACTPERTLDKMYLAPLAERVKKNGGHVYPGGGDIILLIDIKTDGNLVYPVLKKQLEKYTDILTHFRDTEAKRGPIMAILSGNRPVELVKADKERLCGIDGRIPDLNAGVSVTLMPLISDNWTTAFKWNGTGPIPPVELQLLKMLVDSAHKGNHMIRFWGLPNSPDSVWPVLFDAGVDLLNTDDLPQLRAFLLAHQK